MKECGCWNEGRFLLVCMVCCRNGFMLELTSLIKYSKWPPLMYAVIASLIPCHQREVFIQC